MKNYLIKIWNWIKSKIWPEAKVYELKIPKRFKTKRDYDTFIIQTNRFINANTRIE